MSRNEFAWIDKHYDNMRAAANALPAEVKAELDTHAPTIIKSWGREQLSHEEIDYLYTQLPKDKVQEYYLYNMSPMVVEFTTNEKMERIAKRKKDGYLEMNVAHGCHYSCGHDAKDKLEHKLCCAKCIINCDLERVEYLEDTDRICKVAEGFHELLKDVYPFGAQYHHSHNTDNDESMRILVDIMLDRPFGDDIKNKLNDFFKQWQK